MVVCGEEARAAGSLRFFRQGYVHPALPGLVAKLRERGAESRRAVIRALLDQPSQTEEELVASAALGKATVRNALQHLLKAGLAASKRRPRTDGKRGQGPIEYWLTTQLRDANEIESLLRREAERVEEEGAPEIHRVHGKTIVVPAQAQELFVLVKAGTNDAVLTKQGHVLRVEEHALKQVREQYERVLRGTQLEALPLEAYFRRFYPELRGRKDPPVL